MIRELEKEDYHKGFLELINYFTRNSMKISYEEFEKSFNEMNNSLILVIEENGQIIGTGKIIIEQKFHNNLTKMGHIEDVVVLDKYRKKGYGSMIMRELIKYGKEKGCYKVVLNCNEDNTSYYEDLSFSRKGVEMSLYY